MTHNEKTSHNQMHRFCIAPMMDWTDRHCRAFHRVLSRRALLYTEMATADAVAHGDRVRLIGFGGHEHPVALQLGGSEPGKLALAATIGAQMGYDEINLNVGCPSDRVQAGRFGACLMREPRLVASLWQAMQEAAGDIPVTLKCRLGVDEQSLEEGLFELVDKAAAAGCRIFIVHARKAWLQGLSPKENRETPPLDYACVRALKRARPELTIVLNGGLRDLDHAIVEGGGLDGVMLGRAAYKHPALLLNVDSSMFGEADPCVDVHDAIEKFIPYMEHQMAMGAPLKAMTRHLLGAFNGRPGGRSWRRMLSQAAPGAGVEIVSTALAAVSRGTIGIREMVRAD
ncbi:MAG: tRNA dihydrouridine(20/20a) synthase DusA [Hyphomonadaceae bacterium]